MMGKLHTWIERISEDNKKGLRVLHKVLEVDGKKRFKLDGAVKDARGDLSLKEVYSVPYEEAQKEFRKLTNVSQYATFFGGKPKMSHDYEILRYKKFSQLRISSILKPHVVSTIERWLQVNDQDEFTKRIYYTVRDVFTIIRNQEAPISLARHEFNGMPIDEHAKPPRFDQLITKHKGKRPVFDGRNTAGDNIYNPLIDSKGRFKRFVFKEPFQDPKQVLQGFLAGQGEITAHCKIPTLKTTSYMNTFKGLMSNDVPLNIGDGLKVHSNFIGAVSPDHTTFGWSKERMSTAQKDVSLRSLISRRFMSTASSPMHHTL